MKGKQCNLLEQLSGNQPILRFHVILQHDWPIILCLLHIRVSLAGKRRSHVFFIFSCISCSFLLRRFVFCKVEASDWLWAARETPTLSFPPSFARAIETSGYEADRVYRELSRNQPILRFDVILQHDWPIELCLLLVRVSLAGKRRSHVLIFSSIGW